MSTPSTNEFSADERAVLAPFVTDLDAPIFGLRNLPEVVKGALFSRYSRSEKSIRRILLDEFINLPESGFAALVANVQSAGMDQLVAVAQAEAFYDRVLVGYGDDSVAELGGAHVACEEISNVAAKLIEDARIGLSPLEKSTRYVNFSQKVNGQYRYVREQRIMQSRWAVDYEAAMDGLFDTYVQLLEPTIAWIRARTPRDAQTSERAYNSATRAKAFDLLRGLLPMATRTNVGVFANGRAFEYLITRLGSHDLAELHQVSDQLQQALDQLIPSFVKRAKTPRGAAMRNYLAGIRHTLAQAARVLPAPAATQATPQVTLVAYDSDALVRVASAALYPHTTQPLSEVVAYVTQLTHADQVALISMAAGERSVRFHKPGRAFEETSYTFDIIADIGAYRDLQRHRILSQTRQDFGVDLGYMVPAELRDAGLDDIYCAAIERASVFVRQCRADVGDASQYAVPMACLMRWRITLNLREAYHLCELRSSPQGHPTYRAVAQQIYHAIHAVHPALVAAMRFVDLNDYELERLDAERRLDKKLGASQ